MGYVYRFVWTCVYLPSVDLYIMDLVNGQAQLACFRCTLLSSIRFGLSYLSAKFLT